MHYRDQEFSQWTQRTRREPQRNLIDVSPTDDNDHISSEEHFENLKTSGGSYFDLKLVILVNISILSCDSVPLIYHYVLGLLPGFVCRHSSLFCSHWFQFWSRSRSSAFYLKNDSDTYPEKVIWNLIYTDIRVVNIPAWKDIKACLDRKSGLLDTVPVPY